MKNLHQIQKNWTDQDLALIWYLQEHSRMNVKYEAGQFYYKGTYPYANWTKYGHIADDADIAMKSWLAHRQPMPNISRVILR